MIRVRFPIIVAVLEILTYSKNKKFSFSNQWKWLYLCSPENSESFSHENRCNQRFLNKRMNSSSKHLKGRLRKHVCLSIGKYHFFIHPLSHGLSERRPQKTKSRGPKGLQLGVLPPKAVQTTLFKVDRCWNWSQYLYQEKLTPVDIPTGILLSYSETKSSEDCLAIVVELRYQCGSAQPPSNTVSCSQSC